jgi:hypothetical protein
MSKSGTRQTATTFLNKPNIWEIAEAIKLPLSEWHGNCYAIACQIIKEDFIKGRAVYGHYYGPVTNTNPYFNSSRIFQRHGWISADLRIIDPTRWIFEETEPYIYTSPQTPDYDEGGNRLRQRTHLFPPEFDPEDKKQKLNLSRNAETFLLENLLGGSPEITFRQIIWIANQRPETLGKYAKEIYVAIKQANLKAAIPIDNWDRIMENSKTD